MLVVDAKPQSMDTTQAIATAPAGSMLAVLGKLAVRGRAPKTGYSREEFGPAWADTDHNGCDTRDDILRRDLTAIQVRARTHGCVVIAGLLADPYTGKRIEFSKSARGQGPDRPRRRSERCVADRSAKLVRGHPAGVRQ